MGEIGTLKKSAVCIFFSIIFKYSREVALLFQASFQLWHSYVFFFLHPQFCLVSFKAYSSCFWKGKRNRCGRWKYFSSQFCLNLNWAYAWLDLVMSHYIYLFRELRGKTTSIRDTVTLLIVRCFIKLAFANSVCLFFGNRLVGRIWSVMIGANKSSDRSLCKIIVQRSKHIKVVRFIF